MSSSQEGRGGGRDIVAVIGTTGVGKSQLAVSLAQSLKYHPPSSLTTSSAFHGVKNPSSDSTIPSRGMVLSADSMQLYTGLDVITNKVTEEEMGGVEHWGLDCVVPGQGGSWEVGKWCNEADKKIASLEPDTLPIICGGTHYFIQHYLFPPPELNFDRPSSLDTTSTIPESPSLRWTPPCTLPPLPADLSPDLLPLLQTFWTPHPIWPSDNSTSGRTGEEEPGPSTSRISRPTTRDDGHLLALHKLLSAVDEKEAGRWHWRDGRKVRRGLERWWESGGAVQERAEESEQEQVTSKGRRARFRTLVFWVYEPLESLRPRLDQRVDKMVENGLLREIAELRGIAEKVYGSADAVDHTEGIFQSIGYKEFAALTLAQSDPQSDPRFTSMLDRTKLSTHQYAKSQLKWIKKQLLPAVREARTLGGEVEVYVVPGGDRGVGPAVDVLHAFLNRQDLPSPEALGHADASGLLACFSETDARVPDTAERQDINARRDCEACSTSGRPYSVSLKEWDNHIKTKIHKRNVNPVKRDKEQWIAMQRAKGEEKRAEREKLKVGLVEQKGDA
ncbi:hypothetical protein IAR55_001762 [Kwoniella newhampshirensis]|uniref:tRNA dimethylallyltransferase n=1 Tax=Kwoniella newhampshirensis TaxID=1651941 RepID=A0AAW0Z309_9TREE